MKVRTHFHLAKLSLGNLKQFYPKKFSIKMFYFGTILADCCWLVYTNPHFYKRSDKYVEEKLDTLLEKAEFNWYTSIQLGIIIHYLCDFCCYSHITDSIGNVSEHMSYEREIQKYLLKNIKTLKVPKRKKNNKTIKELKSRIKSQILKYRKGKHCFKWDIQNCIEMSSDVCEVIFMQFKNKERCNQVVG